MNFNILYNDQKHVYGKSIKSPATKVDSNEISKCYL